MLVASAIKFQRIDSKYFHIMCGKRHAYILEEMFKLGIEYDKKTVQYGFLTDDDRFVNRIEAVSIAHECHQIPEDFSSTALYSEDVWPPVIT